MLGSQCHPRSNKHTCYWCSMKRMFIADSEISNEDLRKICKKSLASEDFDDDRFVPLKELGSVFVAELFHGPTFCFKDMG